MQISESKLRMLIQKIIKESDHVVLQDEEPVTSARIQDATTIFNRLKSNLSTLLIELNSMNLAVEGILTDKPDDQTIDKYLKSIGLERYHYDNSSEILGKMKKYIGLTDFVSDQFDSLENALSMKPGDPIQSQFQKLSDNIKKLKPPFGSDIPQLLVDISNDIEAFLSA